MHSVEFIAHALFCKSARRKKGVWILQRTLKSVTCTIYHCVRWNLHSDQSNVRAGGKTQRPFANRTRRDAQKDKQKESAASCPLQCTQKRTKKQHNYCTHFPILIFQMAIFICLSKFFRMPEKCLIIFAFRIAGRVSGGGAEADGRTYITDISFKKCVQTRTGHHVFISSADDCHCSTCRDKNSMRFLNLMETKRTHQVYNARLVLFADNFFMIFFSNVHVIRTKHCGNGRRTK